MGLELRDGDKKLQSDDKFHVDYVVLFRFKNADRVHAIRQFKQLIRALTSVGLQTEVRPGGHSSLLVFVRGKEEAIHKALHRERVRDWLYFVRHVQPESETEVRHEPETDAERLRTVYHMITLPPSEGGAGITPKHGEWKLVDSVFPLHDTAVNKEWIKQWSRKTFLTIQDLDHIRDRLGSKVAFYFAFLQFYFAFLFVPAAFGFCCWVFFGRVSPIFAIGNSLMCMVFVELWKRREVDLSLRWQVRGVSAIPSKRREFKHDEEVVDPITGEKVLVFSSVKRLRRQLLEVPFAMVSSVALGTLIATCFAIEIFIAEVYSGPFKTYLSFIPTVILALCSPTISAILTSVAKRLNNYENYEAQDSYDVAMTRKVFVLNFITSYLPIFLTAFVYMPFGNVIVPYLDIMQHTIRPILSKKLQPASTAPHLPAFQINSTRLRSQVIYFSLTAQIVDFGLEAVLPYIKRKLFSKYREIAEERHHNKEKDIATNIAATTNTTATSTVAAASSILSDAPVEAHFLQSVRSVAELNEYDVTGDLREMCVQFGYLTLFSPVWPLVPLSFLVNNWVELRSDFVKICMECKRPTPLRADTIGPWLDSLSFLAWLGSLSSSALVYMFSGDGDLGPDGTPSQLKGWAILLCIFFSEQLYLAIRYAVQVALANIDTPETRKEKAQKYMIRKTFLDATLNNGQAHNDSEDHEDEEHEGDIQQQRREHTGDHDGPAEEQQSQRQGQRQGQNQHITRSSLEEDARKLSSYDSSASDLFWSRQKSWKETALVGAGIIHAELKLSGSSTPSRSATIPLSSSSPAGPDKKNE